MEKNTHKRKNEKYVFQFSQLSTDAKFPNTLATASTSLNSLAHVEGSWVLNEVNFCGLILFLVSVFCCIFTKTIEVLQQCAIFELHY